jgi:DNA repair protein RecO (recombination protein O)
MHRVQLQPAYVLHARPYRESSQLLELATRDFGRVGAVARGARGPRSRWKHILQPFRPLLVSWSQRSDLATLTGADQVAAPPPLQGESLYCGLYLNELLVRFLHRGDPHPELFERYGQTLGRLAEGTGLQRALRLFEKHLLDATGFGLTLDREPGANTVLQEDAWYEYRPESGPVRVSGSARERSEVVSGRTLLALQAEELSDEDLPALRHLMRRVLRHHLGDRPLASEGLYAARRRRGARGEEPQTDPSSKDTPPKTP